jgi:hypothetical protein
MQKVQTFPYSRRYLTKLDESVDLVIQEIAKHEENVKSRTDRVVQVKIF